MSFNWKALQNGSDIRGVALPLIPNESVNLTEEIAHQIGIAFSVWLAEYFNTDCRLLNIGVGSDSRISGPALKKAFMEGFAKTGANIIDFGLATTPAMFMATKFDTINCDASVMLTASHLPPNRNGMKFFTRHGGLNKKDITRILEIAEKYNLPDTDRNGKISEGNIIDPYSEYLRQYLVKHTNTQKPFEGLKILIDAGNGCGGFFVDKILKPLGADTDGSLFLEPDGMFPNHIPNPEDSNALKDLTNSIAEKKADLGIIFDTDVDRAAVIDKTGRPINRNALIALISKIIIEEQPGSYIVTDSVTSDGLTDFIEQTGGKHLRYMRGYKNVIDKAKSLVKENMSCWLAIETSGHAAMRENYFLDDGAFLIAKILVKMALLKKENKTLDSLIENLSEPKESSEFRLKVDEKDFASYGTMVIKELQQYVSKIKGWEIAPENHEGIRIKCDSKSGDGWLLLRLSLHDPVLPLNVESNSSGGVKQIVKKLRPFLKKYNKLKNIPEL